MNLDSLRGGYAVSVPIMLIGLTSAGLAESQGGSSSLIGYEYQRWNQAGMETSYPEDGPYVEVSAGNLEYDRLLDLHTDTQVLVYGYALCNRGASRRRLSAGAGSGPRYRGSDLRGQWPWALSVPRADFTAFDPVQQCNDSARDFSRRSGKSLDQVIREGFAVRIPRALRASSSHQCAGKGLRRGTLESSSVDLDAWIHCLPNPDARGARSGTPTTRPARRDGQDGSVSVTSSFAGAEVRISHARQATQCPAKVQLEADLEFAAAGPVVAQWHASGGYRSPAQTFDVKGPGRTSIQHTLLVESPKGSATDLAATGVDSTVNGWARLVITHEVRSEQPGRPATRANRTWHSDRMDYEINCVADSLSRMQLRRLPD